jgi:hypothetical protein
LQPAPHVSIAKRYERGCKPRSANFIAHIKKSPVINRILLVKVLSQLSKIILYEPIRPYSFLSLEIRFLEKIGFLNPRFLVKNQTIFIQGSAFLNRAG